MDKLNIAHYSKLLLDTIVKKSPLVLLAIFVLILGFWIIKLIVRGLKQVMEHGKIDISLQRFFSSLVAIVLKVLLFISVAEMVGFDTMSFVAILGAAGLAVGMALQGSLANFAGGVLILILKPYKVGDFIDVQGFTGTVSAIRVFNTILKTPDNKTVILPNGGLSNSNLINYSTEKTRRVDMTFRIGYEDDLKKAKEILTNLVKKDERILDNPEPTIVVSELAASSVNFSVKVWCKSADYWGIYSDMQEKVKLAFDQ
ncbi:mechanosensitive ion channel [candidate division KSB1 bacterium]|nr:mechanosensitive ion channel [candidate division KSB1 bacterium]